MTSEKITIRAAKDEDRSFIFDLSPLLAEQARLVWHSEATLRKFQDKYIADHLDGSEKGLTTLIAEMNGTACGFIIIHEGTDELSEEACTIIPLLAVSKEAQGKGVGKKLMTAAEHWALSNGHRLVQLEVFANNEQGRSFYQKQGYVEETLIMVKPLKDKP